MKKRTLLASALSLSLMATPTTTGFAASNSSNASSKAVNSQGYYSEASWSESIQKAELEKFDRYLEYNESTNQLFLTSTDLKEIDTTSQVLDQFIQGLEVLNEGLNQGIFKVTILNGEIIVKGTQDVLSGPVTTDTLFNEQTQNIFTKTKLNSELIQPKVSVDKKWYGYKIFLSHRDCEDIVLFLETGAAGVTAVSLLYKLVPKKFVVLIFALGVPYIKSMDRLGNPGFTIYTTWSGIGTVTW
ncbi:hypothetical protein [[Bacillus] enclensis]|uniref:hypothetical protein n=1 Tax=[Bacillus] enclensis TaxID=1402860 RepID=UPI0018DB6344|nr:hypothetical protein [[Bacillus] enclensis]MBH9968972.1 hypothetical protein [[Bacillus] enclensis]